MDDFSPKTIGKYEIISPLGSGAVGIVYKAKDPQIGRYVAVKTLRNVLKGQATGSQNVLERFRVEARSAGNLRHPNIITIYEVNIEKDIPYIAMDYVEGRPLSEVLKGEGPLTIHLMLYYMSQVAASLDYAHSEGVIHRDIKPSNILVDQSDHVFVLDFGIASFNKLSDSEVQEKVMGTPGYMSPEQILNEKLDGRSDIFSLAIVCFECLAGRRPFKGSTFTELASSILNNDAYSLTEIKPEIPLSLESAFQRAFSRERGDRYKTAQEMISAFGECVGLLQDRSGKFPAPQRSSKAKDWEGKPLVDGKKSSFSGEDGGSGFVKPQSSGYAEHISSPFGGEMKAGDLFRSEVAKSSVKKRRKNFSLVRIFAVVFAVLCIICGFVITWIVFQDKKEGVSVTVEDQVNVKTFQPGLLELEDVAVSQLDLPNFDPVPQGKSVFEMSDKELLGAIMSEESSEALILEALRTAKDRQIFGLVEACTVPLRSDSYLVRVETIKILAQIGDKRIVPELVSSLDDYDPLVRGHTAKALGILGDRRALGYLSSRYMKEEITEVKVAVKKAIERINGYPMKE